MAELSLEQMRELVLSELFTLAAGDAFEALLADAEARGLAASSAEVTRLEGEIAAIDRALGIPPGREPRRLELLAKLRGHFCAPCGGTGFHQGPRLGDEKCPDCDGFGIPKHAQPEAPTVASAELHAIGSPPGDVLAVAKAQRLPSHEYGDAVHAAVSELASKYAAKAGGGATSPEGVESGE